MKPEPGASVLDGHPENKSATRIVERFLALRQVEGLQKRPATSEMLTWARVLARAGVPADELAGDVGELPYLGTLLKTREDFDRVRRRPG